MQVEFQIDLVNYQLEYMSLHISEIADISKRTVFEIYLQLKSKYYTLPLIQYAWSKIVTRYLAFHWY